VPVEGAGAHRRLGCDFADVEIPAGVLFHPAQQRLEIAVVCGQMIVSASSAVRRVPMALVMNAPASTSSVGPRRSAPGRRCARRVTGYGRTPRSGRTDRRQAPGPSQGENGYGVHGHTLSHAPGSRPTRMTCLSSHRRWSSCELPRDRPKTSISYRVDLVQDGTG
jgi:hypothetical protein